MKQSRDHSTLPGHFAIGPQEETTQYDVEYDLYKIAQKTEQPKSMDF